MTFSSFEVHISPTVPLRITVTPSSRSYAHYTPWDAWETKDSHKREINIASGTLDRPIENIIARNNLIKVFLLTDEKVDYDKCLNYDIIITTIDDLNLKNSYKVDSFDNLGEDLISIIYSHFKLSKKLKNEV